MYFAAFVHFKMDIDTLKGKRRIIKSSCTRIKNYVDSIESMNIGTIKGSARKIRRTLD